jgi:hypothetical protein
MKVLDQGVVYDASAAAPARRFCAFTDTTVLSDGRILVAFHCGSAKESLDENVIIRATSDGGRAWETVLDGLAPLTVDGRPGTWHHARLTELAPGRLLGAFWWIDRTGGRPMINPETTGTAPNCIFLMDSHDDGRTWTDPRPVDTAPFPSVALMTAPLLLSDGRIAVVSEAWKTFDDPSYGEHSAILTISRDRGHTFEPSVVVAHDPANRLLFWDQRPAVDPETGRLIALFWTHDREVGRDTTFHAAWSGPDAQSWTYPVDTGIAGQIPRPLFLPGGRVFCAYIHRHSPPSLRAVLSPDAGRTWDVANELLFYEHSPVRQAGMDTQQRGFTDYYADMTLWSFGHVDAALLPDGSVFVSYYAGDAQSLSVRWARIGL